MKIRVYGVQADERPYYREVQKRYGFDLTFASEILSADTVHLTKGFDGLIIMTNCKISGDVARALKQNGVRFLATRTAGTDHIDVAAVHENGLSIANVPSYSPNAIAEHTVMTALNLLRHTKRSARKIDIGDFTMTGLKGRELGSMTAGVWGVGQIGLATMRLLNGFGCRVLSYGTHPSEEAAKYSAPVTTDILLKESDIIFLHCPLRAQNYHMIDRPAITQMKDGAFLVNTARGGLVDAEAVLAALQEGKLAGYGFDVYETEAAFLRKNIGLAAVEDQVFRALLDRDDVIYTAHVAFYTDTAIESMISVTLDNLKEYELTGTCRNEVH